VSDLATIERFVNTANFETGEDELADRAGLERWAAEAGLVASDDLERVVAFREALRRLLADPGPAAAAELDRATAGARLTVAFDPDGSARLDAADGGVIAGLLAIVARAQADGTWSRLKVCAAEDCRWAFYDRSRNHSRTWCSMEECGNRAKARSYRARQR
jgi:predicted RNA-binding Zn ribbon-like protein